MSLDPLLPRTSSSYADFLEDKLNTDLGFYYWKKYVAAAFWSQVSMPINLVITLMTALTTAQAASPNLLPDGVYRTISISALILTVVNTFFRPHEQMTQSLESMQRWNALGIEFEKVYYNSANNNYGIHITDLSGSILQYAAIQEKMNALRGQEGPATMNWFTDMLHMVAAKTCLRRYQKWLDFEKEVDASEEDRSMITLVQQPLPQGPLP